MLRDLIIQNRSYRRFYQQEAVSLETLRELVDLARLSASAGNLQPLKYVLVNDPVMNAKVFPRLGWAGYLKDWKGPREGERPAAYIIVLLDKNISESPGCDHGIACQSILLGAVERGLGGCMIGTVNRQALCKDLALAEHLEILLVLALGKPKETVVLEKMSPDGSIRYWRDEHQVHHVPKRSLDELIIA